jgi:RHS repeat-associated protein
VESPVSEATPGAPGSWAQYNGTVNGTNNNQMSQTNQNALQASGYDASGDVTNDGVNQYLYDAEGRICAVASMPVPGMTTMTGYLYDTDGTRVAKGAISAWSCDPGADGFTTTTDYVLGLSGEQVTEMSVSGTSSTWSHTNVWAVGKLLATYDMTGKGLHFYLDDPLATRRVQTDELGVVEQTCSSLPFGDGLTCSGSTTTPTEHHFTGKERDTESGNDYFGARYYASSMGRFMSPDPYSGSYDVTNPQSFNRYVYASNLPLSTSDSSGLDDDPCSPVAAVTHAFGGVHAAEDNGCDGGENGGDGGGGGGIDPPPDPPENPAPPDCNDPGTVCVIGNPPGDPGTDPPSDPCAYYNCLTEPGSPEPGGGGTAPSNLPKPTIFKVTIPGTNYCGPGGNGAPTTRVDGVCAQHDKCEENANAGFINNVTGTGNQGAIQACNAQLCSGINNIPWPTSVEMGQATLVATYFNCGGYSLR